MYAWKAYILGRSKGNTPVLHWTRVVALHRFLLVEEIIERNPCLGIEPPRRKVQPPTIFTADDLRRMMAACRDNTDRVALYAHIFTGMREGEVQALSLRPARPGEEDVRAYIDFEADCIRITSVKGGKSRNVPLHPLLRKELQARRPDPDVSMNVWMEFEKSGEWFSDEWVFPNRKDARNRMVRLMKASTTPGGEHQFRRTMLTWMDEHGVTDSVRHALVGHAGKGVEQRHYLSVSDERKREAINGLYAGELPGTEAPTPATDELAELRRIVEEQAATIKTLTAMVAVA
jgi:integrase